MSGMFPRGNTCDLLRNERGNAFWMGAYYADRNIWLHRAREEGISKEQRQLRVSLARSAHRIYLIQRRALKKAV